jgi:hypothetical protein
MMKSKRMQCRNKLKGKLEDLLELRSTHKEEKGSI